MLYKNIHRTNWGGFLASSKTGGDVFHWCLADGAYHLCSWNAKSGRDSKLYTYESERRPCHIAIDSGGLTVYVADKDDLIRIDVATGEWKCISRETGLRPVCVVSTLRAVICFKQENQQSVLYAVGDMGEIRHLSTVKGRIGDPEGLLIYKGVPLCCTADLSPDEKHLCFVLIDLQSYECSIELLALGAEGTEARRIASCGKAFGHVPHCRFITESSLVFSDYYKGYLSLYLADLEGRTIPFHTVGSDIRYFAVDLKNSAIACEYTVKKTVSTGIAIFRPKSADPQLLRCAPGVNIPLLFNDKENTLLFCHSSAISHSHCRIYHLDTDKEEMALNFSPKGIELPEVISPVQVHLGGDLTAKLYVPSNNASQACRMPVVVWLRGGPTVHGFEDYIPFESWLCLDKFVVLAVNYRGTLGQGQRCITSLLQNGIGDVDVADVIEAIGFCKSLPIIDATRIGLVGVSYGGYLVLEILKRRVEGVVGGFCFAAITDWSVQQRLTAAQQYDQWLLGEVLEPDSERNKRISPIYSIGEVNVPLMVTHGMKDDDVPFEQIRKLAEETSRNRNPWVSYHFYPDEGHGLPAFKNENCIHWHESLEKFLTVHLCPDVDQRKMGC